MQSFVKRQLTVTKNSKDSDIRTTSMNLLPLTFATFMGVLLLAHAILETTSIGLFVDNGATPLHGPNVAVPHSSSSLRFFVNPQSLRVRYKLKVLDAAQRQRTDGMYFIVRFLAKTAAPVLPIRHFGTYDAYPRNAKFLRRAQITLVVGQRYQPDLTAATDKGRDLYQTLADEVIQRIGGLTI